MKNMLNIKEIEGLSKLYEFRMSYKAKIEIDKINREQLMVYGDETVMEAMPYLSKLNDDSLNDEERMQALKYVLPLVQKQELMKQSLDLFELGYVLLHSLPENKEMTKEQYFDEVIPDIENKIGFEKMFEEFQDMHDKVFTLLEKLNKKSVQQAPQQAAKLLS